MEIIENTLSGERKEMNKRKDRKVNVSWRDIGIGIDRGIIIKSYIESYGYSIGDIARWIGISEERVKSWIRTGQTGGIKRAIEEMSGERVEVLDERGKEIVIDTDGGKEVWR